MKAVRARSRTDWARSSPRLKAGQLADPHRGQRGEAHPLAAASGRGAVGGAGTFVVAPGGAGLGKPEGDEAAREALARLSDTSHEVLTRVVLAGVEGDAAHAESVVTRVTFRAIADDEIDAYVALGEGRDKAGGYAVQDATFRPVDHLTGCYLNVVGLPVCAVAAGLNALGRVMRSAGPPPCRYCERGRPLVRSG